LVEPTEFEVVLAAQTEKMQGLAVLEANVVRNLAFQRSNFSSLLAGATGARYAILAGVETKTLRKKRDVRAADGSAETFDWWEYLFGEIVVDVRVERTVFCENLVEVVGILCGGLGNS
jgi:hypothetical protein